MDDDKFKHRYAILVLFLTVIWAALCLYITYQAVTNLGVADIVTSAGANVLLGALIIWNANINQHYFRKGKTEEKPDER